MTNEEITNAIAEASSLAFAHIREQVADLERTINGKAEPPPSKEEIFRQNMGNSVDQFIEDEKTNHLGGKDLSGISGNKVSGSGPLGGKEV